MLSTSTQFLWSGYTSIACLSLGAGYLHQMFSKGLLFKLLWLEFYFLSLYLLSCFAIFSRASFAPPRKINLTSCTFITFPLVYDTTTTLLPCISFHPIAPFFFPFQKSKQRCSMVSLSCNTLLHSAGLKGRSLMLGAPSLGKHEFQSSHPQPWAVINTCTTADLCCLLKALSSHSPHDTRPL